MHGRRKVLIASILGVATVLGAVLIVLVVFERRTYGPFLEKAERIRVGDTAEQVIAKMAPETPTTNNSDLIPPVGSALVFRKIDVLLILHMDESGRVVHIEKRGT
jgi:hypothetical protein